MKIRLLVITIFFLSNMDGALGADTDIRLNSLGFLPGMPKKASIIADCSSFSVVWEMLKNCLGRGECASPDSFLLHVMDRRMEIEKEPAEDRSGRLNRLCIIYPVLRLLNVRTTFVPVTFRVPLEEVNSPVSFESASFPSKLDSNFRSPNSRTILKLT